MATFLLTGKALKTFKKAVQPTPQIIPPFDGWYVDIFVLRRKKAVLITHENSYLSFVCYLTEVGGIQKVFDWFLVEIEEFVKENSLENHDRVLSLLSNSSSFHKTRSRKVIGHMTDFKNLIQNGEQESSSENSNKLKKVSIWLHDVPVCIEGSKYGHPKDLFLKLLAEHTE